jgi:hypothetical protein
MATSEALKRITDLQAELDRLKQPQPVQPIVINTAPVSPSPSLTVPDTQNPNASAFNQAKTDYLAQAAPLPKLQAGPNQDLTEDDSRQLNDYMSGSGVVSAPKVPANKYSDPALEREVDRVWKSHGSPGPGNGMYDGQQAPTPSYQLPQAGQPIKGTPINNSATPPNAAPNAAPIGPPPPTEPQVVGAPRSGNVIADQKDAERQQRSDNLNSSQYTQGVGQALGVTTPPAKPTEEPKQAEEQPQTDPNAPVVTPGYSVDLSSPGGMVRGSHTFQPKAQRVTGGVDIAPRPRTIVNEETDQNGMYEDLGIAATQSRNLKANKAGKVTVSDEDLQALGLSEGIAGELIGPEQYGKGVYSVDEKALNLAVGKARYLKEVVPTAKNGGSVEGFSKIRYRYENGKLVNEQDVAFPIEEEININIDEQSDIRGKINAQEDILDGYEMQAREKRGQALKDNEALLRRQIEEQNALSAERMARVEKTLAEVNSALDIDPQRWWKNKSTGSKIALILGAAFMGFGAGANGAAVALNNIQKQIDNDIEAQKANYNKKANKLRDEKDAFSVAMGQLKNKQDAENALRGIADKQVLAAIDDEIFKAGGDKRRLENLLKLKQEQLNFMATKINMNAALKGTKTTDLVYDGDRYVGGSTKFTKENFELAYKRLIDQGKHEEAEALHKSYMASGGRGFTVPGTVSYPNAHPDANKANFVPGVGLVRDEKSVKEVNERAFALNESYASLNRLAAAVHRYRQNPGDPTAQAELSAASTDFGIKSAKANGMGAWDNGTAKAQGLIVPGAGETEDSYARRLAKQIYEQATNAKGQLIKKLIETHNKSRANLTRQYSLPGREDSTIVEYNQETGETRLKTAREIRAEARARAAKSGKK